MSKFNSKFSFCFKEVIFGDLFNFEFSTIEKNLNLLYVEIIINYFFLYNYIMNIYYLF